jgi:hypothetical protein
VQKVLVRHATFFRNSKVAAIEGKDVNVVFE